MNKEICILNGTKWILGDESTEPMNWEDANNWCKSIGQDLPPREVLLMAFLNPEIRSKFANGYYWSSSEFDSYSAWDQDFNIGDQNVNFSKSAKLSVRAVRAIIAEASEQTEQEPVAWITEWVQRYRHNDTPIMDRAVSFTKGDAPAVPNPNYIPLYTALPTHLISAAPELLEALSNWINALDDPSEWMKCRDDAKKAIEKAHGITGVDYE